MESKAIPLTISELLEMSKNDKEKETMHYDALIRAINKLLIKRFNSRNGKALLTFEEIYHEYKTDEKYQFEFDISDTILMNVVAKYTDWKTARGSGGCIVFKPKTWPIS